MSLSSKAEKNKEDINHPDRLVSLLFGHMSLIMGLIMIGQKWALFVQKTRI